MVISVQFSHSDASNSATPCTAECQGSLSITNSWSMLRLLSTESVMAFNHLILCCPLLLLPSESGSFPVSQFFESGGQSFEISASASVLPVNSGLISFRMDWLDLLAVKWTLKSLLQHHSLKASILRCSVFFMVQLSHPYMTSGKTIALTRWTFVDKVMSLLFNVLFRFIIAFLPRSKLFWFHSCSHHLQWVWNPLK